MGGTLSGSSSTGFASGTPLPETQALSQKQALLMKALEGVKHSRAKADSPLLVWQGGKQPSAKLPCAGFLNVM